MVNRWRSMRGLLLLPIIAATGILYLDLITNAIADGGRDCVAEIHAVDDVDGKPIAGAKIRLFHFDNLPPKTDRKFLAGSDGKCSFPHKLNLTRNGGIIRGQYFVGYGICEVEVSATGFEKRVFSLNDVRIDSKYYSRDPLPPVVVRLSRVPSE